jgi:hypothetical protein
MTTGKALALDITIMEERLHDTHLSATCQRCLLRDPEFQAILYRNDQLMFLRNYCDTEFNCLLNNSTLDHIFGITEGNVAKIRCKAKNIKKDSGRPHSLSVADEESIIRYIVSEAENNNYLTKGQLLSYVHMTVDPALSRGWLYSFFARRANELGFAVAVPRDKLRQEISRGFLDHYIDIILEHVNNTPADFVFNLDEVGVSDFEDASSKKVVVPRFLEGETLHLPVDRSLRHLSLEACVCAGGDRLMPFVVATEQRTSEIFRTGIREGTDLQLFIARSPYFTESLFYNYINDVFIPFVLKRRDSHNCPNQHAILFMDNLFAHCSDRTLQLLSQHNIRVISFPPHSTHIFQMLDLVVFGVMKHYKSTLKKANNIHPVADHLHRAFRAFELATVSSTIRASFEAAGFNYIIGENGYVLQVNVEKIRSNPDFLEMWNTNFDEALLTPRRRNARWGVLNPIQDATSNQG